MINFLIHVTIIASIYVILAASYNLILGYSRLFSVAHAAFYGIGAYFAAILTTRFGVHYALAALLGLLAAALVSVLVGLPSLRVSGEYLMIVSFGLQVIISGTFRNWTEVTKGVAGIPGVPRPSLFGVSIQSEFAYLLFALAVAAACLAVIRLLVDSPYGRLLRAIRDDPVAVSTLGKNVVLAKVSAFAVAGSLAAVAGSVYTHYVTFASPDTFDVNASITVLTAVIIGGAATFWGPVVGALLISLLPQALRFLEVPAHLVGPLRQLAYGLLLVAFVMFRPEGIIPEHRLARTGCGRAGTGDLAKGAADES